MCVRHPYLVPALITRLPPDHAAFHSHYRPSHSVDVSYPSIVVAAPYLEPALITRPPHDHAAFNRPGLSLISGIVFSGTT